MILSRLASEPEAEAYEDTSFSMGSLLHNMGIEARRKEAEPEPEPEPEPGAEVEPRRKKAAKTKKKKAKNLPKFNVARLAPRP